MDVTSYKFLPSLFLPLRHLIHDHHRASYTARICHSNSKERLVPYLGLYTGVLGPEGNLTLPRRRGAIVE